MTRRIDAELLANLVTASEIARRIGVGRAAVANWSARHVGFPEPVVRLKYDWREVEAWLIATRRRTERPIVTPEHELLHAHRKACLVCANSLSRRSMCSVGQQLRDDVVERGHRIERPVADYRFRPHRWRP